MDRGTKGAGERKTADISKFERLSFRRLKYLGEGTPMYRLYGYVPRVSDIPENRYTEGITIMMYQLKHAWCGIGASLVPNIEF